MSRWMTVRGLAFVAALVLGPVAGSGVARAADNARQIVEESQKRTTAQSQRYEGVLQVFDAKGKISDKIMAHDAMQKRVHKLLPYD